MTESVTKLSDTLIVEGLNPRIYINSFPKSGTHLAILVTLHMAQAQKPKYWLGSFKKHSWSKDWVPVDKLVGVIKGQPAGTWMMGHMGYDPEIDRAFREMGTCMIFVYRDLRDVAVSLTYHIENTDDQRFKHLDKALYMAMPDHQARLKAVIEGIPGYPGIVERWELYEKWMGVDWVLPVKFEDMRNQPETIANQVVDYVIERTMEHRCSMPFVAGDNYKIAIKRSIEQMNTTEHSGSFRAGRVGDWRDEFTTETLKSFHDTGGDDWIERLGYKLD